MELLGSQGQLETKTNKKLTFQFTGKKGKNIRKQENKLAILRGYCWYHYDEYRKSHDTEN